MSELIHLQIIEFPLDFSFPSYDPIPRLNALLQTVSAGNCLERIKLPVILPPFHRDYAICENKSWRELDSVLGRTQFKGLTSVLFEVHPPYQEFDDELFIPGDFKRHLSAAFASLQARELVRITMK